MSNYNLHLNQFADNGKTIGCLGGTVTAGICSGGAAFITIPRTTGPGSPLPMRVIG